MYSDNKTITIENHPMIGQVIRTLCTGLEVDATVVEVTEDRHRVTFHVDMHQDVQWGDQTFTKDTCSMRKFDQWIIGTKTVTAEQFLAHKK